MKKNQTQLALKVFKCLLENSDLEGNLEIQRKVAECHLKLGDHQNALRTYEDGELSTLLLSHLTHHHITKRHF